MAEVHPAFGLGKKKCMNMNLTARNDFWKRFSFLIFRSILRSETTTKSFWALRLKSAEKSVFKIFFFCFSFCLVISCKD